MNEDEVAFRIVRLYFEEIARLGFKRQLDLDQIINAYFYVLNKLGNKEEAMKAAVAKIIEEENKANLSNVISTTKTTTTTVENKSAQANTSDKSTTGIVEGK